MSKKCSLKRYEQYLTKKDVIVLLRILNISQEDFWKFIYGQGCPLIKGKPCFFSWDVKKFIQNKLRYY